MAKRTTCGKRIRCPYTVAEIYADDKIKYRLAGKYTKAEAEDAKKRLFSRQNPNSVVKVMKISDFKKLPYREEDFS